MEAKETKTHEFLTITETEFVIPVYQRNYDWTKKHCEMLWEDILDVGKKDNEESHFIGSIVYIHEGVYKHSEMKNLMIIDGQQRLTTLTLIYLALYKFYENQITTIDSNEKISELKKEMKKVKNLYLTNEYNERTNNLKLRPIKENAEIILDILNSSNLEGLKEKYNHNILDNFFFFYKNLELDNYQYIKNGLNKLIFVYISLDREKDDPQRIFESLNSTGLDLNEADLIRNHLMIGLNKEKQEHIYEIYWKKIEKNTINKDLNYNKTSDFIRNYLILKFNQPVNESSVYQSFKKYFPRGSYDELINLLSEILDYSWHYAKILNVDLEQDKEIKQHLIYFQDLNVGVIYPFLMQIYHDYMNKKISKEELIEVYEIVQSYLFRRYVVNLPTKSLNKVFPYIYKDVNLNDYVNSINLSFSKRTGEARFPNDEDVKQALVTRELYNRSGLKRLMYCLMRLEYFKNKEPVDIKASNLTIEHIFPQTPHKEWLEDMDKVEYENFTKKYLNTIGNLTLSGNNAGLGNKSFKKKRDYGKNGYKNSNLWLNRYLAGLEDWNEDAYTKRVEDITHRFLTIWKAPLKIDIINEDLVNIFEISDPTNKKIKTAIFEGEELNVNTVSELYREIFIRLIDRDIKLLLDSEAGQKIYLTQYAEKLRTAMKLNEDWYIEGNASSADKFKKIKLALELFDLKEELLLKYQDEDGK